MFKSKFLKLILLLPLTALILSGCTIGFDTGAGDDAKNATDGGVYKSLNKGANWEQKVLIQSVIRPKNFAGINIISLALDPSDNKAIYAGSLDNGLFYSYDGADGWQAAASLGKLRINSVAVDPADKCVIYVASDNKVFKSNDCSRTWAQVYFDNDLKVLISSLVIDHSNSSNIFIGTSRGDIIKSSDKGGSWRVLDRFGRQIDKIVISPVNPKIIFAGTTAKGIFRSKDGGAKWENLSEKLKAFNNSNRFRDLIMLKLEKPTLFLATDYGLLKSTDNGDTWSSIELLTPEKEAKINAIAASSLNGNEIYYVTETTFYRTSDGGKNWITKKLPTSRAGVKLLIDPKNAGIVYLAVKSLK